MTDALYSFARYGADGQRIGEVEWYVVAEGSLPVLTGTPIVSMGTATGSMTGDYNYAYRGTGLQLPIDNDGQVVGPRLGNGELDR